MSRKRYSLKTIVGKRTYDVWVSMLEALVPDGRTQRLAHLVAAMMHYATKVAFEESEFEEGTIGEYLLIAEECGDPSEVPDELRSAIATLFSDATWSNWTGENWRLRRERRRRPLVIWTALLGQ